jgi:hypothetical protein
MIQESKALITINWFDGKHCRYNGIFRMGRRLVGRKRSMEDVVSWT